MLLLAAGVLVAGLAGCGRRGPLEAPPDPSTQAATSGGDGVSPVVRRPKRTLITPPDKPFVLDPLL